MTMDSPAGVLLSHPTISVPTIFPHFLATTKYNYLWPRIKENRGLLAVIATELITGLRGLFVVIATKLIKENRGLLAVIATELIKENRGLFHISLMRNGNVMKLHRILNTT